MPHHAVSGCDIYNTERKYDTMQKTAMILYMFDMMIVQDFNIRIIYSMTSSIVFNDYTYSE